MYNMASHNFVGHEQNIFIIKGSRRKIKLCYRIVMTIITYENYTKKERFNWWYWQKGR